MENWIGIKTIPSITLLYETTQMWQNSLRIFKNLEAVLRIRDILVQIQIWLTDPDPHLWLTDPDPDPAIFVSDLQEWQLKIIFFCLLLFEGTLT
jgi:hypothetical protein